MIEVAQPLTEYIVTCANKHRSVVESLPGVEFDEAPSVPSEGWPSTCPECAVEIPYDQGFDAGWRSKMGAHIWRRPDTGEEHRDQHEFGAGAIYEVDWGPDGWTGPDGKAWGVVLPPGGVSDHWIIDAPASSGGHWERTGTPPNLNVTPSILTPRYHGFLQNGVLTDSLSDRPL